MRLRNRKVPARSGPWSRRARPVTSGRRCLVVRIPDPARRRLSAPGFRLYRVALEGVRHLSSFLCHPLTTSYKQLCRIILRLRCRVTLLVPALNPQAQHTHGPAYLSDQYAASAALIAMRSFFAAIRSDYMHLPSPQSLRNDPSPTSVVVAKEPHPIETVLLVEVAGQTYEVVATPSICGAYAARALGTVCIGRVRVQVAPIPPHGPAKWQ